MDTWRAGLKGPCLDFDRRDKISVPYSRSYGGPTVNRVGRGGSILEQLEAAIRKSLSINVLDEGGNVNFPGPPGRPAAAFKNNRDVSD